ncbi:MAG: helix-turn-helix domain-containing protein [Ferrimicrobium sp.]
MADSHPQTSSQAKEPSKCLADSEIEHVSGDMDHDKAGLSRIGTVATRLGVSERTLRYYEEVGLVHPVVRGTGASRRYREADVERIKRIRELQELMGFNLEEIRSVICAEDQLEWLRGRYLDTIDQEHQRNLLEEADRVLEDVRARVEAKTERLKAFLTELDLRIERHRERLESIRETAQ